MLTPYSSHKRLTTSPSIAAGKSISEATCSSKIFCYNTNLNSKQFVLHLNIITTSNRGKPRSIIIKAVVINAYRHLTNSGSSYFEYPIIDNINTIPIPNGFNTSLTGSSEYIV